LQDLSLSPEPVFDDCGPFDAAVGRVVDGPELADGHKASIAPSAKPSRLALELAVKQAGEAGNTDNV
jgi:hypothetical protein